MDVRTQMLNDFSIFSRTFYIYIYFYLEKLGYVTGNDLLSCLFSLSIFSFIFTEIWQTRQENLILLDPLTYFLL